MSHMSMSEDTDSHSYKMLEKVLYWLNSFSPFSFLRYDEYLF